LRSPHLAWLAEHLKRYRASLPQVMPGAVPDGAPVGGYYTGPTSVTIAAPVPPVAQEGSGDPGILRMAIHAVHAMNKADSTESGMKTVPAETHQQRLAVCATCPHHTGVRCKLSDSFTSRKAWLPHETCPAAKWAK
jgi:hypothetical protein